MVRNRIRGWLAPLRRLYASDDMWKAPILAGTVLGAVMALGGITGALTGFVLGAIGMMIVRIYTKAMRP